MLRSTLVWLIFLPIFFGSFAMLPTEGRAATIALESSSASILAGALVEIRIYGIGFDDGTDGGDFALSWPSSLSFVDLAIDDPPWDPSSFDAAGAAIGSVSFVDVFSFVDTPGIGGVRFEIATLTLRAITADTTADVTIAPAQVGWSLAGGTVDAGYGPPVSIEILVVPEPTTAGLLGLGLAILAGCRRRT